MRRTELTSVFLSLGNLLMRLKFLCALLFVCIHSYGAGPLDVLIIESSNGHVSAARNIALEAQAKGLSVERASIYSFKIPLWSHLAGKSYTKNYLNNTSRILEGQQREESVLDLKLIKNQFRLQKLRNFILKKKPKVILVTYRVDLGPLHVLKKEGLIPDIPLAFVETDYRDKLDSYLYPSIATMTFVPSRDWLNESIKRGISEDKLTLSGIPVDSRLKSQKPWSDYGKWKKILNISEQDFCIGLNGGTLGAGDFPQMIDSILAKLEESQVSLIVATGNNQEMYNTLKKLHPPGPNSRVKLLPFHEDLPMIMKHFADVYVTKPGGLSITEAAVMGKPLIIVNRGQGQTNIDFFQKYKMATFSSPDGLGDKILELMGDEALKKELVAKQSELRDLPGALEVVSWLKKVSTASTLSYAEARTASSVQVSKEACGLFLRAPVRRVIKVVKEKFSN